MDPFFLSSEKKQKCQPRIPYQEKTSFKNEVRQWESEVIGKLSPQKTTKKIKTIISVF